MNLVRLMTGLPKPAHFMFMFLVPKMQFSAGTPTLRWTKGILAYKVTPRKFH